MNIKQLQTRLNSIKRGGFLDILLGTVIRENQLKQIKTQMDAEKSRLLAELEPPKTGTGARKQKKDGGFIDALSAGADGVMKTMDKFGKMNENASQMVKDADEIVELRAKVARKKAPLPAAKKLQYFEGSGTRQASPWIQALKIYNKGKNGQYLRKERQNMRKL